MWCCRSRNASLRRNSRRIRIWHPSNPRPMAVLRLPEFSEKRLRVQQIFGVEAFGEPVVDRGEQFIGLLAFALALPQTCETGRCAQFPHFRLLTARPIERGEEVPLSAFKVALEREHPALEAQDLGVVKALLPSRTFDLRDRLVEQE